MGNLGKWSGWVVTSDVGEGNGTVRWKVHFAMAAIAVSWRRRRIYDFDEHLQPNFILYT